MTNCLGVNVKTLQELEDVLISIIHVFFSIGFMVYISTRKG